MARRHELLMMQEEMVLPDTYQAVDYIWGDGRQRIITDVIPSSSDIVEADFRLFDLNQNTALFGTFNYYDLTSFNGIGTNQNNLDGFFCQIGSGDNYVQSSVRKDTSRHKHIMDIAHRKYIIDEIETDMASLTLSLSPNPYGLLFMNSGTEYETSYDRNTAGRIYGFSIRGKMNLQPCIRIADQKPGTYDLRSKRFYTNVGSSDFHVNDYFNWEDIDSWWIATSANGRVKSKNNASITISNNVVTLIRASNTDGLCVALGYLEKDKTYRISGVFTNTDCTAYIAKVTGCMRDDSFASSRKATSAFVNNSVLFTPTEEGIYELLVWSNNSNPITAENVNVTKEQN